MSILPKFLEGTGYGVLNDILSGFHSDDGYATPNRFEVIFTGPKPSGGLGDVNSSTGGKAPRKISIHCESIQLPARAVESTPDVNIYGVPREVANRPLYAGEVTMSFQSSSNLEERVFFEEWQQMTFNPATWNVGYYENYVRPVDIYIMDKQDKRRYGIRLHECFPKEISAVDMGYSSNNELLKINVNLQYRYWDTLDITRQSPNIMGKILNTVATGVERQMMNNIPRVLRKLF